jgi:hypothetical protein
MRRPVDPLGYSEDAGIFVYRSDPVHQLGRHCGPPSPRLGIGQHLLDCGDHFVDQLTGPSGCALDSQTVHWSRLPAHRKEYRYTH